MEYLLRYTHTPLRKEFDIIRGYFSVELLYSSSITFFIKRNGGNRQFFSLYLSVYISVSLFLSNTGEVLILMRVGEGRRGDYPSSPPSQPWWLTTETLLLINLQPGSWLRLVLFILLLFHLSVLFIDTFLGKYYSI